MNLVRAEAAGFADEQWPGRTEVHLRQSDDSVAVLTDEAPVRDSRP